jgi:hypothetical protein
LHFIVGSTFTEMEVEEPAGRDDRAFSTTAAQERASGTVSSRTMSLDDPIVRTVNPGFGADTSGSRTGLSQTYSLTIKQATTAAN